MREILFRGKQISDGEWVEGHLGIEVNNSPVIQWCEFDENYGVDCVEESAVIPETVGQYTGLTDKNGAKIFDGDILHATLGNFVARWSDNISGFVAEGKERAHPCMNRGTMKCYEIIGNIYDNPELVEVIVNE